MLHVGQEQGNVFASQEISFPKDAMKLLCETREERETTYIYPIREKVDRKIMLLLYNVVFLVTTKSTTFQLINMCTLNRFIFYANTIITYANRPNKSGDN